MSTALQESIKLTPTDGNGVAVGGDMAQIAPGYTYTEVDEILRLVIKHEIDECYGRNSFEGIIDYKNLCNKYGKETVDRVISRYRKSEFKRKHMPIVIRIKENPSDKLLEP
jgi:NH3-dependent NAD+ synthetase